MPWDDDLNEEQKRAASHVGSHARLLAGPGTGKTLAITRRVLYLVKEKNIEPSNVLVVTFTRAAAYELRQRVSKELKESAVPRISTLHSYCLRQLLRNSRIASDLPKPLRIADDWEERYIVLEDLKRMLGIDVDAVREKLNLLSSDWQTLEADAKDWDQGFPDPKFLGAWQEHRGIYGYLLRAELVYRLKRALEQRDDLDLEGPPKYVLVDEYQDLNRCDLAVIQALASRGSEIFVAGDDDQSIYGFRKAHPEGIRRFTEDYHGAHQLSLSVCKRCDPQILKLGLFVAEQDHRREPKVICAEGGRAPGEVQILRFSDQKQEARGVAHLCKDLIKKRGYEPHEILILTRSDRNQIFSSELRKALQHAGIPVVAATSNEGPLDQNEARQFLALLRLGANPADHLAWRTLLQLRRNSLGEEATTAVYELARNQGVGFSKALESVEKSPDLVARFGSRLAQEVKAIRDVVAPLSALGDAEEGSGMQSEHLLNGVRELARKIIQNDQERESALVFIQKTVEATGAETLEVLLQSLSASSEDIEQEVEEGKVNILTMHKAKGLTAKAVIVVAAEDEYIPGRATGSALGDERRLLYVSLTRAKHDLFITYCTKRTGAQQHSGRNAGQEMRTLTRFLRDGPIAPISWKEFTQSHP
jgi:DNA helicase-2/ATP-dependent DNA helicase PcrA